MSRSNNRGYKGSHYQQQQVLYVPKEDQQKQEEPQQKKISYYVENNNRNKHQYQKKYRQKDKHLDPDYERKKEENHDDDDEQFDEEAKEQFDFTKVQQKELTDLLMKLFKQRRISCPICFFKIKDEAKIWNCRQCFQPFHLGCISKWIKNSNKDSQNKLFHWSCPKCNLQYSEVMPNYVCFCGKLTDPENNRYQVPHSCENKCSKKRGKNCPHPCPMDCHPGPCPECQTKGIQIKCHCGKFQKQIQCSEDITSFSCNQVCGQQLNCRLHTCQKQCHPGACQPCLITCEKQCYCGQATQNIPCGQQSFSCNKPCGKLQDCGKHVCPSLKCHPICDPCLLKPELITRCPCGRYELSLIASPRVSCLEPIPSCGTPFQKQLDCGHRFKAICGQSNFQCKEKVQQSCTCGKEFRIIDCYQANDFKCDRVCKKKKSCQVHYCNEECCPVTQKNDQRHLCLKICDKPLPCNNHRCELFCHIGTCQPCPIVSNEALPCYCGKTSKPPPNRCGTKRPECQETCNKPLPCGHDCQSTCHNGICSACMQIVMKKCRCGNETLEAVCSKGLPVCKLVCSKPLPCGHKCLEVCADGPCRPCAQRCGRKRPCGHLCQEICHGNSQCPLAPCRTQIQLHCACGSRDAFVECGMTEEVFQKELKCNQRCQNIKRFGLFYSSTMVDFQKIFYPNILLKFAHYNLKYLQKLEQRIEEFLLNDEGGSFDISFGKSEYSDFKKTSLQILLGRHYKFEVQFAKVNRMFLFTIFKREDTISPKMKLSDYFSKIQKGQIQRDSPFEAKIRTNVSLNQSEIDQLEQAIREYRNDYYLERNPTHLQINFWEEQHAQEVLKRIKKVFNILWTLEVNKQAMDEKSKISVENNEEIIIKQNQRMKDLREEFQGKANCHQMCDDIEAEQRSESKELDIFEQDPFYAFEIHPQREWIVRKRKVNDNLRSPDILIRTVDYLVDKVADADHPNSEYKKPLLDEKTERNINFQDIWMFIHDRFDVVLHELKLFGWFQEIQGIYEKMIRFYVIGCYELVPFGRVEENIAILKRLLIEYFQMPCQSKDEFIFYYLVLKKFENWSEEIQFKDLSLQVSEYFQILLKMKQLDQELQEEKFEQLIKQYGETNNYLEGCILFNYQNIMREKITIELAKTMEKMNLQEYSNLLSFKDLKSGIDFFEKLGYDINQTIQEKEEFEARQEDLSNLQIYFAKIKEKEIQHKKLDKRLNKLVNSRRKFLSQL